MRGLKGAIHFLGQSLVLPPLVESPIFFPLLLLLLLLLPAPEDLLLGLLPPSSSPLSSFLLMVVGLKGVVLKALLPGP